MTVESELRDLGDRLGYGQQPITVDEIQERLDTPARVGVSSPRRRLLLVAAVFTLLAVGLASLLVVGAGDDDPLPIVDSIPDATSVPTSITPSTTTPEAITVEEDEPDVDAIFEALTLGSVDSERLRPLNSLSAGDIVIPTAPSRWWFASRSVQMIGDPARPGHRFGIGTKLENAELLDVFVVPACEVDETTCALDGSTISWPVSEGIEIGGTIWGYPDGDSSEVVEVAAVIGNYVVAIAPSFYEPDGPMLEDPDVVEFIEGLRVGSPADLPDSVELLGRDGTPIDPAITPAPIDSQTTTR